MASEHATTGDAINHAVDKASAGLEQISHAISGAAPKVAKITLATVQADAFANVVYGIEALIILVAIFVFWRKVYWPWARRVANDDMDFPIFIAGAALVVAFAIFGFVVISTICDPWTYIAMAHPDMYLAHKVIANISKQ